MATYVEFVGSGDYTGTNAGIIRDWANRDVSVLSNSVVSRCIEYAADEAYKTLRVPPLEFTRTYVVDGTQDEITAAGTTGIPDVGPSAFQGGGNVLTITAPSDMIEVIFIRNADTATKNIGIVYNEKVDILESYSEFIHSPSVKLPLPSIVKLKDFVPQIYVPTLIALYLY